MQILVVFRSVNSLQSPAGLQVTTLYCMVTNIIIKKLKNKNKKTSYNIVFYDLQG